MKRSILAVIALHAFFLIIASGGETEASRRLRPEDFRYLGAFRLPGGKTRPATFAYGDNAMTFDPDGDPTGTADGYPGSSFITGHERMPYGELPSGDQIAEVSIPAPAKSKDVGRLPKASFLQGFHDVARGLFDSLDEIPRVGIHYLSHPATGPKIHMAWGQNFQDDPRTKIPSHAWIGPDLSSPDPKGTWYIGKQSLYSVNGYMFEIPTSWADAHASGRYLATGRFRDGGWSGKGPALFAYRPWIDDRGTPPPPGAHLQETVLLLYESSYNTNNVTDRSLRVYQHCDEWEGGPGSRLPQTRPLSWSRAPRGPVPSIGTDGSIQLPRNIHVWRPPSSANSPSAGWWMDLPARRRT